MTPIPPPTSTAALISEERQLGAKPLEVLAFLQARPKGARVVDIAAGLGIHSNTVRGHLDELAEHGLVDSALEKPTGRGRPTHRYWSRSPRPTAVASEYLSLVEVLISTIGDPDHPRPEDHATARRIGSVWAERTALGDTPWTEPREAIAGLITYLRSMGFSPRHESLEAGDRVELSHCPFIVGEEAPSPLICSLHLGFIEALTQQCPVRVSLQPLARPGLCTVDVYPDVGEGSTST